MGRVGVRLDNEDRRSLVLWAADCADHVLGVFEDRLPTDNRPRRAVEAARFWARGEITVGQAREAALAAHAAARETTDPAARAAARAAGHAAATAHMPGHAARAATYATTAASLARVADASAAAEERRWQHVQLPERRLARVAFPA